MSIAFHKLVASGNDFILVDNRKKIIRNPSAYAKKACAFHYGVGADGVILIESSKKEDFLMRIINSDGSEAEACGNGYRCVGLYAHKALKFPKKMKFETLSGPIDLEVTKIKGRQADVKVKMIDPFGYQKNIAIKDLSDNRALNCAFINTGVPHVVIFVENLKDIDVENLGRSIRYHSEFMPRGTNVNFVQVVGENQLKIRTYERGVEAETLACGTGTVAASVISGLTNRVSSPVLVETKGGEVLNVSFNLTGQKVNRVYLQGSAEFVFEGSMEDL